MRNHIIACSLLLISLCVCSAQTQRNDNLFQEQPLEYLKGKGIADRQKHLLSTYYSVFFDENNELYLDASPETEEGAIKESLLGLAIPQGITEAEPFLKGGPILTEKRGDDYYRLKVIQDCPDNAYVLHDEALDESYFQFTGRFKRYEEDGYYRPARKHHLHDIANLIVKEFGGHGECKEDGTYSGVAQGVAAWDLEFSSLVQLQSGDIAVHVVFTLAHRYVTGHYTLPGKTVTVMGETMTIGGGTFANTNTDRQYYQVVLFFDETQRIKKILPLPFHDDFEWYLYASNFNGFWFARKGERHDINFGDGYIISTIKLRKGDEVLKFDDNGNIILKYTQEVEGEEYYNFEETELYLILAGSTTKHGYIGRKNPAVLFINKNNPNQTIPKYFTIDTKKYSHAYDDNICSRVISMLDEIVFEFIGANWIEYHPKYEIGAVSDYVPNEKPVRSETRNKITSDGSELGVVLPKFQGEDARAFSTWVAQNSKKPERAPAGTVIVRFAIKPDGTVFDVKVLEGVHPLLDAEAVRVVKSSPKWTPAQLDGKPIAYGYQIPIIFSDY